MPQSRHQKRKTPLAARQEKSFPALCRAAWDAVRDNYGGMVLAASMLQLFLFLIVLGSAINFQGPADAKPFGWQGSTPAAQESPLVEEKRGLPPMQTAVFCVYAVLCLIGALILRNRVAARQFRIVLYLQVPGLVLAAYAIARFAFHLFS